jgi:hypothetical protein
MPPNGTSSASLTPCNEAWEAAVVTHDHDMSSIRTQLTVARWHLDAAVGVASDAMLHNLRRARQLFEDVARSLPHLRLTRDQREEVERELAAIRSRWEAAAGERL